MIGYNELSWPSNKRWFIPEGVQNFGNWKIFSSEWFDHIEKMQNTENPPYYAFYSILRIWNTLEAEYTVYVILLKSGLNTKQAVVKLKLSKPPFTGVEGYQYLQHI